MDKMEYLSILNDRLSSLPPRERSEAIKYYGEMFNDAGIMNEQSVISSLGSPQRLAHTILNDKNDISYEFKKTRKQVKNVRKKMENENDYSYAIIAAVTFPLWGTFILAVILFIAAIFAAVAVILAVLLLVGAAMVCIGVAYITKLFSLFLTLVGLGIVMICLSFILFNPAINFTVYLMKVIIKNSIKLVNKIIGKTEAVG